jgi:hypothetical protein
MGRWIIQPNVLGGWDVRAQESAKPSFRTSARKEAEAWARTVADPGDKVVVLGPTGRTLKRFTVPAAVRVPEPSPAPDMGTGRPGHVDHGKTTRTAPKVSAESGPVAPAQPPTRVPVQPYGPAQPAVPGFAETLEEGERLNGWIDVGAPIAAALGAAFMSPEVATAAAYGWIAVFVATLTWSLGCAMATYFIISHRLEGWNAAAAAAASLLAALAIASGLGIGVLDIGPAELSGHGTHPVLAVLIVFGVTAFETYGYFGAILSAGIGIWLGYRAAQRFPAT